MSEPVYAPKPICVLGVLAQWYVEQDVGPEADFVGGAEAFEEARGGALWLANQVINRLIARDNVLVYAEEYADDHPQDTRMLGAHPGYEVS